MNEMLDLKKPRPQFFFSTFNVIPFVTLPVIMQLFKRQETIPEQNVTEAITANCSTFTTEYDLSMHIWAIFIVLVGSLIGTLLPKLIPIKTSFFRLLGCGIILATGYIHMLTPAQELFMDPCLPVIPQYAGWSGALALFGLLLAHALQVSTAHATNVGKDDAVFSDAMSTAITLEFGTAIHSVLIGLTLGMATEEFIPLLVAISFHQFFEGLALSSIIQQIGFTKVTSLLLFLGLYVVSTPVGIILGIVLRETIGTQPGTNILVQAVLDSISGGILIYNGLVNILAPYFATAFHQQGIFRKILDVSLIWVGCLIMAVIGIWA
jgi:zinc transporter 1/2/3